VSWNPFIGWSQADLEAELVKAQTDFAQGKTTVGASDSNVMVKNAVDTKPGERIRLILYALHKIAPSAYPIGDVTPTTQTRVVFGT
jgi:hypothetical protein